jgi:hypothetical protein
VTLTSIVDRILIIFDAKIAVENSLAGSIEVIEDAIIVTGHAIGSQQA